MQVREWQAQEPTKIAPTGVTQVLGAVAVAYGADTTWAGLKQAFTGEEHKTFTEQGTAKLAEAAGASKESAEKIGAGVTWRLEFSSTLWDRSRRTAQSFCRKPAVPWKRQGPLLRVIARLLLKGEQELRSLLLRRFMN